MPFTCSKHVKSPTFSTYRQFRRLAQGSQGAFHGGQVLIIRVEQSAGGLFIHAQTQPQFALANAELVESKV